MSIRWLQQNSLWLRFLSWIRDNPLVRYPDLGLVCLGIFVMLVGIGAVVPIRTIYAREQGATPIEIGLMASALLLGNLAFQLPGGWASDKWGRKPLLVTGVAVGGIVSFLFLLSDHPWYFITLRFIDGLAGGAIFPAANAYVLDTVPAKERGAAYGWLGSAFSAGFMLGPAIGGIMVDFLGFASPFIFGGVTGLLTALLLIRKMRNVKPGDRPTTNEEGQTPGEAKTRPQVPKRLFVPALVGVLLFTVAGGFGDGLFISIWTLWLDDLNASTSFIGFTFITFSLPMMVFMPTTGKWADRYRLAPLIAIPSLLISFAYLAYGFVEELWLIAALGLLEGAVVAVMVPALSAYIADLSPDNARGRLQGFISTARTLAGAGSAMLVVWLYDIDMAYPFFMLAGMQVFIAVVGGLLIWRVEKRTRETASAEAVRKTVVQDAPEKLAPSAAPLLEAAGK